MTTPSPWQQRIHRALELSGQHIFAKEILEFYIHLARFQENLYGELRSCLQSPTSAINRELTQGELAELSSRFDSFLSIVEARGPKLLNELSRDLRTRGEAFWLDLLSGAWATHSAGDVPGFLAMAFLQPYAELLRSRSTPHSNPTAQALCPHCDRRPGFGVLRQMGEGSARSLVCAFCVGEWQYRRLVCPGCGEENDKQLPVFTAADFDYIRLDCCDTCKTYVKSIDLTKNGRAEPLVDELASAPLDLWARDHGYAKLRSNLLGM